MQISVIEILIVLRFCARGAFLCSRVELCRKCEWLHHESFQNFTCLEHTSLQHTSHTEKDVNLFISLLGLKFLHKLSLQKSFTEVGVPIEVSHLKSTQKKEIFICRKNEYFFWSDVLLCIKIVTNRNWFVGVNANKSERSETWQQARTTCWLFSYKVIQASVGNHCLNLDLDSMFFFLLSISLTLTQWKS